MKSIEKIEKFWDRTAQSYDKEEEKDRKVYQQIINEIKSHLKTTDDVLDFGCGTGLVSNKIANSVKQIHAIDLSSKMIEIAKIKAERQKIINVKYVHSTIFDDNLKSNSYDVVLGLYILHLLEDPRKVVQKINTLLKPDGIFISVTPCMGNKNFYGSFLSVLSKLGIVPPVRSFKSHDLKDLVANEKFKILENSKLPKTSNQYYILAKK